VWDTRAEGDKYQELKEKWFPGFTPVGNQKKRNDGQEETDQSPPNAFPKGGDQEKQTSNDKNCEPQEDD